MKEKIMIFVIGVLVGAILATGAFYIYNKLSSNNSGQPQMQMPSGNPPEKPDGENGEPPEKPDGEPPEKPSDN